MEETSRKRARLEQEMSDNDTALSDAAIATVPPTVNIPPTRDAEYWFEDGNIILVAQHVSFKVYKGLLAEHSEVFRSMFLVAQGSQASTDLSTDGCPVVTLDDSPEDLRQFFRLIYPLSTNFKLNRGDIDIDLLSAVIRLDHKYELVSLYAEAINHLTTYYTMDFNAWISGENAKKWKPKPIHAIGAIALARLTNTLSILPTAFYELCALGPSALLNGYISSSGTVHRLPESDLELCVRMRDSLTLMNTRVAFILFKHNQRECLSGPNTSTCSNTIRTVLEQSGLGKLPHSVASRRALESWLPNFDAYLASPGMKSLCNKCRSDIETREKALRHQIWCKLPEILDITIDGWDTPSNP
ncbi:hypothetical protein FKP32DRAFT_1604601 [Trametes sanguinea]|nr:hypothetical protein FKP32DRAFT_1604601 [Trametes sanguinea]